MFHRKNLEALLRRPAYTNEDKFRVLDARDKLMRLTAVQETDINKTTATSGTCPDMCPEKERLMRDFQRQVSIFELDNDDHISHEKAIKEYSRSSADQEKPLAHELRPEPVLRRTMLYLLSEIADISERNDIPLGDWYHFFWDRTRSIRKDITQQELCSPGSVQLIEQCARFHIHCAGRLVAEDSTVFDKKINTENLTKCLQTLKYMYHDLRLKKIHCPCEAEFRSYIILLNLANANFLWELKQLPDHILAATEIKRAIAFYNALQNNNYVRFFKLLKSPETNYLSACILLGYCNVLRLRALEIINVSFNGRKKEVFLPMEYFMRILCFESIDEALSFLEYYDIQCDNERVLLNVPTQSDLLTYNIERAIKLIESKRNLSIGECIAGHDLKQTIHLPTPHNSFDENNILKKIAWNAYDQNPLQKHDNEIKIMKIKENHIEMKPASLSFSFLQEMKSLSNDANDDNTKYTLIDKQLNAMETEYATPEEDNINEEIIIETSTEEEEEDEDEDDEEDKEDNFSIEKEKNEKVQQENIKKYAFIIYDEILTDIIENILNFVYEEEKQQLYNIKLLKSIIDMEIEEIIQEQYNLYNKKRINLNLYKVIEHWKNFTKNTVTRKNILTSIPTTLNTISSQSLIQNMAFPYCLDNITLIKRYRTGEACDYDKLLPLIERDNENIPKIKLYQLIYNSLQKYERLNPLRFFKILLLIPAEKNEEFTGFNSIINKWLPLIMDIKSINTSFICHREHQLVLCIRKMTGLALLNEEGEPANQADLAHMDAIICCCSLRNTQIVKLRLQYLLRRITAYKPITLALIFECSTKEMDLNVEEVLELNMIPTTIINAQKCYNFSLSSKYSFAAALKSALIFVAKHSVQEPANDLEMLNVKTWLDKCLGAEVWLNWRNTILEHANLYQAIPLPGNIIKCYNAALQHLQQILEENLQQHVEVPYELHELITKPSCVDQPMGLAYFPVNWKQMATNNTSLITFLDHLKLPACEGDAKLCHSTTILTEWCLKFANLSLPEQYNKFMVKCIHDFLCLAATQMPNIDFFNFIEQIANMRLKYMWESIRESTQLPQIIIYKCKSLFDYLINAWWLEFAGVDLAIIEHDSDEDVSDDKQNLMPAVEEALNNLEQVIHNIEDHKESSKPPLEHRNLNLELNRSIHNFELTNLTNTVSKTTFKRQHSNSPNNKLNHEEQENSNTPTHDYNDVLQRAEKLLKRMSK